MNSSYHQKVRELLEPMYSKQRMAKWAELLFFGTPEEHKASEIIKKIDEKLLSKTAKILNGFGVVCDFNKSEITRGSSKYNCWIPRQMLVQSYIYQRKGFRKEILIKLQEASPKHYKKIDRKLQRLYKWFAKKYIKYNAIKIKFDDRLDRLYGSGIYGR